MGRREIVDYYAARYRTDHPGRDETPEDKVYRYAGGACNDYAPDTLAPDPLDRDVCTTCLYRGIDHPPIRAAFEAMSMREAAR